MKPGGVNYFDGIYLLGVRELILAWVTGTFVRKMTQLRLHLGAYNMLTVSPTVRFLKKRCSGYDTKLI